MQTRINARYIRALLGAKGMKIETLAEACGVSRQHIHNILSGRSISVDVLVKIAQVLGVDPGDILADGQVNVTVERKR